MSAAGTIAPATDGAGNLLVTYQSFVTAFPEFGNSALYPASQIEFWLPLAYTSLNAFRFGVQLPLAVMLFTAHNIILSAREVQSASGGKLVGNVQGALLSKSIGPISASYSGNTAIDGAGAYNFTSYGQRLYTLMRAYAAGPKWVPRTSRWAGYR